MIHDDVIRIAMEAGFEIDCCSLEWHERIQRFAALVAANEREACARVCENIEDHDETISDIYYSDHYANAIRARGEA